MRTRRPSLPQPGSVPRAVRARSRGSRIRSDCWRSRRRVRGWMDGWMDKAVRLRRLPGGRGAPTPTGRRASADPAARSSAERCGAVRWGQARRGGGARAALCLCRAGAASHGWRHRPCALLGAGGGGGGWFLVPGTSGGCEGSASPQAQGISPAFRGKSPPASFLAWPSSCLGGGWLLPMADRQDFPITTSLRAARRGIFTSLSK